MINATIKTNDFIDELIKDLSGQVNTTLNGIINDNSLLSFIKEEIADRIRATNHYQSLIYGDLAIEFGLLDAYTELEKIINILGDGVKINFGGLDDKMNGNFEVEIPFERLLQEGSYVSTGGIVPWLDWLLTAGSSIVIADYQIVRGSFESSRTGGALMVKGGDYHVPLEYSGTESSNFITEALKGIEDTILERINNVLS